MTQYVVAAKKVGFILEIIRDRTKSKTANITLRITSSATKQCNRSVSGMEKVDEKIIASFPVMEKWAPTETERK